MHFIDTHAHMYSSQFEEDRHAAIDRALLNGVKTILLPNIDRESIGPMHELCATYPQHCFPMMGLHPCSVEDDYEAVLADMRRLIDERDYVAIGETGIDLYWDKSTLERQKASFRKQIQWAKELELPLVIHARDSFSEIFEVLDEENDERLRGVFHCFTGSPQQAEKILSYQGFLLGLGGVLTFKNSGLDKTIAEIDMEHLILETDAPYLAPVPYRGKRNESSYLLEVAMKLCDIKELELPEIARITTRNAQKLFALNVG